jgi:glycine betaine/proline transport system substrate-binding protein
MDTKGEPDLAPELWINSIRDPLEKAFSEKRLHSVNGAPITGLGEGWWVPQYFLDANPDIKTIQDVIKRPDLFPDKEDASKGAFVTCPAGWACQLVNANLFKAFEMESKGWKLVNPGSGAGLDGSIAKAFERKENWFGYYWSPTSTVGKYPMVKLDFGVPYAGDEHWNSCMGKDDCKDPKPTSWTVSEVHSVTSDSFKNTSNEEVAKYLQDRIYPGSVMNEMLVYMTDNQATGADAAIEFLRKKSDLWTKWVSADAAEKIKAAVK